MVTQYIAKKPDKNGIIHFTPEENETWSILIDRQIRIIHERACDEFIIGLNNLKLPLNRIPQCAEVSAALQAMTGWSVVPVDTLIPLDTFFSLLAQRKFPAASFIRLRAELDYLQEPDIFHEFFGHCPLLTQPDYANFVQWYGEQALQVNKQAQSLLGRLFWFTVEFGLVHTINGLRIYGGGILSSYQETLYALESEAPHRLNFDLMQVLATEYRYDQIQKHYFILNDISELFQLKTDKIIQLVKNISAGFQDNNFVIC